METSHRGATYPLSAALLAILGIYSLKPLAAQQIKAPYPPVAAGVKATTAASPAAATPAAATPSPQDMSDVIRALGEVRQELKDSRQEVDDLRKEVIELRQEVTNNTGSPASAAALQNAVSDLHNSVDDLHDNQAVLQSQVKTLAQTKVETVSKYPMRFTGMILFNSYVVDGAVDNPILPLIALPKSNQYVHHSLGGSLDQTLIGLDLTGPTLWGAHTSGDINADFFDAERYTTVSTTNPLYFQLRTADIDLDWKNTRVSAGLQNPLISPLSPHSFATVGEPALAWAGNLWSWLPQVSVEHRFPVRGASHFVVDFGALDPSYGDITGESTYGILRNNLQPAYEGRTSYRWGDTEHPYEVAASGYYTRQLYYASPTSDDQTLDFWAGTADWHVPVAPRLDLSGEFYRGRGIGDLGGGAFKNVVKSYSSNSLRGLNTTGGWTGLTARFTRSLEANAYFGEDSANAYEAREEGDPSSATPYLTLVRNQSAAANLIFRPKTYLVFSGEYRYLRSWYTYGPSNFAQNLDLTMGYIF